MWGATFIIISWDFEYHISIHAPRVGSDATVPLHPQKFSGFQSTLPVWGATVEINNFLRVISISIHAPRVGSDILVI